MESNKFFYNTIYSDKYKNYIDEEIIDKNDNCYGPCYPPNTLYYHPTQLIPLYDDEDHTCPIITDVKNSLTYHNMKCEPNDIKNLDDTDLSITFSNNSYSFLKDIYNIKNYENVISYLEINIKDLPIFSQKRILNSIYCAYINNENFPNKNFIYRVKNVLEIIFNLKLNSKKIYDNIINIKNKKKYNVNNDIFIYLFNKYLK